MKKTLTLILITIASSLIAQTWESLDSDKSGFLSYGKYDDVFYRTNKAGDHFMIRGSIIYKFTENSGWKKISSGLGISYREIDYQILENDTILYAYTNLNNRLNVIKKKDTTSIQLGSQDYNDIEIKNFSLKINDSEKPYIAFINESNDKINVITLENNLWISVGASDFSPAIRSFKFSLIGTTPAVIYYEGTNYQLYVKQYLNSSWTSLGGKLESDWIYSAGYDIQQTEDGSPIILYEASNNTVKIRKWSSNSWNSVFNLPRGIYNQYSTTKLAYGNGNFYVAYNYDGDTDGEYKLGVKKYDGTTLTQIGDEYLTNPDVDDYGFGVTSSGECAIIYPNPKWGNNQVLHISNNNEWETLNAKPISPAGSQSVSSVVDRNNFLYAAFQDYNESGKISVMKFEGGKWSYVGTPGFTISSGSYPTIVLNKQDSIYVICKENNSLKGYKYDGSEWKQVFSGGSNPKNIDAAFNDENTLYITYLQTTNNSITNYAQAYKYSSSSGLNTLPKPYTGNISSIQMRLDNNGAPITAYTDSKTTYRIYAKRYNGSTWTGIGGEIFNGGASDASIACDSSGNIYVGYGSWLNGGRGYLKKLSGNSWQTVNNSIFSKNGIDQPKIVFNKDQEPVLFYKESNIIQARISLNGKWKNLADSSFSSHEFNDFDVSFKNDNYYLTQSNAATFAYRLLFNRDVLTPTNKVKKETNLVYYFNNKLISTEKGTLQVYTTDGRLVHTSTTAQNDISHLPSNIYIVKLVTDNSQTTSRFYKD